MDVDALRQKYFKLAVASCEWRALGVAEPGYMAEQVFAELDPRRDHNLRGLFSAIEKVVLTCYQRNAATLSVLDRMRGPLFAPRRARTDADDFLAALSNLRRQDRELLQYRFWDDLDETETAEVMGVSPEVVRERLLRSGNRYLAKLDRRHPNLSQTDLVDTLKSIRPGIHRRFG